MGSLQGDIRRVWIPKSGGGERGLGIPNVIDRVHHQRLLARMGKRVGDGRVLKLVHRMLKAKVVLPDGTRVVTEQGTPQGGPLSSLLSNIVLDELDWELDQRGEKLGERPF